MYGELTEKTGFTNSCKCRCAINNEFGKNYVIFRRDLMQTKWKSGATFSSQLQSAHVHVTALT